MQRVLKHRGHCLPHWDSPEWPNFITFRLGDSLPNSVIRRWNEEVELSISRRQKELGRRLSIAEERLLKRKVAGRVERFLDSGHGECVLADPGNAEIVERALKHFDGQRYEILSWCVMPNHVHLILETHSEHRLEEVVKSLKGFTAREINKRIGREGPFWQAEYFDHMLRNGEDLLKFSTYILENPIKAGLQNWRWAGGSDFGNRVKWMNDVAVGNV